MEKTRSGQEPSALGQMVVKEDMQDGRLMSVLTKFKLSIAKKTTEKNAYDRLKTYILFQLGTCNASNSDGFEYLQLWTWNDHLEFDPLGVTDVETQCISGRGGHFHAVNDNEPYSGYW